jgi:hypothetical protein
MGTAWVRPATGFLRRIAWAVLPLGLLCLSCATQNVGTAPGVSTTQNFVGQLVTSGASAVSPQAALVAFVVAPKDDGTLDVRAYMCDGVEEGEVAWVRGAATAQSVNTGTFVFDLTSPTGYEFSGTLTSQGITGTLVHTTPEGSVSRDFVAPRAPDGIGIYDMAVDGGTITGTSLTGDDLRLTKSQAKTFDAGDGRPYMGTLTSADGIESAIALADLATLTPKQLEGDGFIPGLAGTAVLTGNFRAIIAKIDGNFTVFGRILLPGTGVNGIPPKFELQSIRLSSRVTGVKP